MSFLKEYTLLSELGQGGFAKVYKVRHNDLGYIRAIRVLNETVTDEKSVAYQKFLRECRTLLRLGNGSNPNIVHIYQPRLLESHALVEMDFVDGTDISRYLEENGNFLPIDEVLRMVEQMSNALAYCHEDIYKFCMDREEDQLRDDPMDGNKVLIDQNTKERLVEKYKVIHNDIHSGNIMRREDGNFVLLDFGLAITGVDDVRNSSRHENGAVEYKAPEKWDNDALLTEQSDIYSFGIVMYEYLAGRVPFPFDKSNPNRTEATFKLSKSHKEQAPPSIFDLRKSYYEKKHPGATYQKDYPDWLEYAIMHCLEKDPGLRFHNGKELHDFVMGCLKKDAKAKDATITLLQEEVERMKASAKETCQVKDGWVAPLKNDEPKESPENETMVQDASTPQRKPWRFIVLLLLGLAAVTLLALDLMGRKALLEPTETNTFDSTRLVRQNDSLRQVVVDLRKEAGKATKNHQNELSKKQQELDGLNQRIADLQKQLDDAKKNPEEVKALTDQINSLNDQVNTLNGQINALNGQVNSLKKDLDQARKQNKEWESSAAAKDNTIKQLRSEVSKKENSINDLNKQLSAANGRENKLKSDVNSLKSQLKSLDEELVKCMKEKNQ